MRNLVRKNFQAEMRLTATSGTESSGDLLSAAVKTLWLSGSDYLVRAISVHKCTYDAAHQGHDGSDVGATTEQT